MAAERNSLLHTVFVGLEDDNHRFNYKSFFGIVLCCLLLRLFVLGIREKETEREESYYTVAVHSSDGHPTGSMMAAGCFCRLDDTNRKEIKVRKQQKREYFPLSVLYIFA